jgi:pantetheine-phosphate adenylyltransferase
MLRWVQKVTVAAEERRIAVCPGSYDPVTNGHLDVIERAAKVFDLVVIGVVHQPMRKQKTVFTAEERRSFLLQATQKLVNVEVEVFDTLLVDFARKHGATALVKGLRAISDFEYEFEMNQLNRTLAPDIETLYLMASPRYSFLRSSGVKELASFGGNVADLVPPGVARALQERLASSGE